MKPLHEVGPAIPQDVLDAYNEMVRIFPTWEVELRGEDVWFRGNRDETWTPLGGLQNTYAGRGRERRLGLIDR